MHVFTPSGASHVILQEQSQTPIYAYDAFMEGAGLIARAARDGGAEPVLLMTWERPDSLQYGVTTQNLARNFEIVGHELGVRVIYAGLAFDRSTRLKPGLLLYHEDAHPTRAGTYLTVCTPAPTHTHTHTHIHIHIHGLCVFRLFSKVFCLPRLP